MRKVEIKRAGYIFNGVSLERNFLLSEIHLDQDYNGDNGQDTFQASFYEPV